MKTIIITAHEEQYSDNSITLGVLCNDEIRYHSNTPFKESFTYIYKHEKKIYIFFNTMVDLFDYMFYGADESKIKMLRAYLPEAEFDTLYDMEAIEGKFTDRLTWTT